MGRKRRLWSYSTGRYGSTVRIYEPRLAAPLRFDWREDDGTRHRPEVSPALVVRRSPDEATDPVLTRKAEDLCERKAAELRLEPLREESAPDTLTLGRAYDLFFDERRRALPKSRSARTHHEGSRDFWLAELGAEAVVDGIPPADVLGALKRLKEKGQTPTALKRLSNLRTLINWLREDMGFDTLRDPTRGRKLKKAAIRKGHQPRRRRFTDEERDAIMAEVYREENPVDPRFRLFMTLVRKSGPRGVQARTATRRGLDVPLEPPPPKGHAPHGWLVLPAAKDQDPMIIYLSAEERAEIDAALAGYLAKYEAAYQAGEITDYPLMPGGRMDRDELTDEPISDRSFRLMLHAMEDAAGVDHQDWRGFHGFRRSWVDEMDTKVGLDTAAHAGGWSDTDMVEGTYVSRVRYDHLERARKAKESGDDAE